MSRQRTILVGYDGLDAADRALARAVDEARAGGAKLVVLAVSEMPLNPEGPQNFGTLDDSPATMIPLTEPPELASVLGRAQERVEAAGLQADYAWAAGEPAQEIVVAARERGADLVVVGHHHHGLMGRLFGEDVAAGVKRAADCEVIAVD
jgi:nucleotide-binding universal stress UspA family protein